MSRHLVWGDHSLHGGTIRVFKRTEKSMLLLMLVNGTVSLLRCGDHDKQRDSTFTGVAGGLDRRKTVLVSFMQRPLGSLGSNWYKYEGITNPFGCMYT